MICRRDSTIVEYMHRYGEVQRLQGRATSACESGDRISEKKLLDDLTLKIIEYEVTVPKRLREAKVLSDMNLWKKYCTDRSSLIK